MVFRFLFWNLSISIYCFLLLPNKLIGLPSEPRKEQKINSSLSKWTRPANAWMEKEKQFFDKFTVTVLPYHDNAHELPLFDNFFKNNVTSNNKNNSGVDKSRLLWNVEQMQSNSRLSNFVDKAMKLFDVKQVMNEVETSVMSKVSCTACKVGAGLLQHFIKTGKSEEAIVNSIFQFCVSLKIQSQRVCHGLTLLMGGEVIFVLKQIEMTPAQICSFVIGDACEDVYNPLHDWEVAFPPKEKPKVLPLKPLRTDVPVFKVLHISDTHYDPYYQEGSNAECNEPLCCRLTNGPPADQSAAAGRWGDYRKCDMPKRTLDHMLQHIRDTHSDIDYIIWTGDLPPHDVWNQTKEENLKILHETVLQMTNMFPGVPIFPSLGNHETVPVNSYPPPFIQKNYSISWLYDELDSQWRRWLPASTAHTIRQGAFYSVLVRPGFRILSINTNYCNNKNWWLLLNSTDPVSELQWLIFELHGAEMSGERVHIIGHIPPGHSDCLKVWSRNYYHIINRYESTIMAQFFGHTHYDEFEVFYDTHDYTRALNIGYIGPSATPYFNLNPGYRIYYIDGDHINTTRMVIDHESWIMNLNEANMNDRPVWYKLYSARQAYQMPSTLPNDWDNLIDRMMIEPQIFEIYYKHYHKDSPVRPPYNEDSRKRLLCDLRSGKSHDRKIFCDALESKINGLTKKGWRSWIYNGLAFSLTHDRIIVQRQNWLQSVLEDFLFV